jgi:hypothetical protein
MAVYYFRNVGVNWGTATNWSLTSGGGATGAVPTNADDVIFDVNSGNCTVDTQNRVCKSITFTGYLNVITMTFNITVGNSTGATNNIIFQANQSSRVAGAGALIASSSGSINSNGGTWPNPFQFTGTSQTFTLGDNLTLTGLLTVAPTTGCTISSNNINCTSVTFSTAATISGTTTFNFNNGGTWQHTNASSQLRNNVNINSNVTISGNIYYNTGTLTWISGTPVVTGSTLNIANANTTLVTSGMSWNNVTVSNTTAGAITLTLNSTLTVNSTFTLSGTQAITFGGTSNFSVDTFNIITTGAVIHRLVSTRTYTVTNTFNANPTGTTLVTLASTTGGSQAILNFSGSNQSIIHLNVTDINSSAGNILYTLSGTLTNATNWLRADLYFRNAGTDWATAANWSLLSGGVANGIEPTSIDNVFFDGNSTNCVVPAGTRACANFTTTAVYTNNLNLNANVAINGNLTLGNSSMTFGAGTGLLNIRYNASSQTRILDVVSGLTVPRLGYFSDVTTTNKTLSLVRSTTVNNLTNSDPFGTGGTLISGSAFTLTIINGTFTNLWSNLSATTTLEFSGSCNFNGGSLGGGTIRTLSGSSLTVTGNWVYGISGTIDFSLGTVNFGTNNFQQNGANITLNFPFSVGSFFNFVGLNANLNLQSDVVVRNDYSISGGVTGHAINGALYKFIVQRNASINGGATVSGTATISFEDTVNNGAIIISTVGTVTFSISTLNIQKSTAQFTLDNTTRTLRISSANYTVTSGTIINVVSTLEFSGSPQTITHLVPATYNNITITGASATKTLNGNVWNIAGTLNCNVTQTFAGSAGWTAANFTNTTAGTIITFANINTSPSAVYTVNNVLTIIGTALSRITFQAAGRVNFNGGIAIPVFPATTSVMTTALPQSLLVGMTVSQTSGTAPAGLLSLLPNRPTITSQITTTTWNLSANVTPAISAGTSLAAGFKAIFTLAQGASQTVAYVTTQDIDSSRGQTVWAFQSDQDSQSGSNVSLYRTINWNSLTAPKMAYYTWVG